MSEQNKQLEKQDTETETEVDPMPDEQAIEESMKWKFGTLKDAA